MPTDTGASMGPQVLRVAGLAQAIAPFGMAVEMRG